MFLDDPAPVIDLRAEPAAPADRPVVAVHPGSGSLKKNWPVERWIQAGRELAATRPGVRLALVTGEAEQERGITAQVLEGWRGMDFLHWDQRPLVELAGRLGQCAGFIGHDSGVSHLAAALICCRERSHRRYRPISACRSWSRTSRARAPRSAPQSWRSRRQTATRF
jgi:ADP-heptose:LPS heptosyltransferase